MAKFDYVIVGAGTAGCVLANRLSEDASVKVLLIEAGGKDSNPLISVPKGFGQLMDNPKATWHYRTRPFGPTNRVEDWVRGRTLGGSSSVNGMVYNRGQRADYDEIERLGNPGWGWETILPIFRTIEDNALGASDNRGAGGPLHVSTVTDRDPLLEDVIAAGVERGWQRADDLNETDDERIGYAMATIKNGRRFSAAKAFLHPITHRPNLTVALHTVVDRVLIEDGRAVGVRTRQNGQQVDHLAEREVILAAGGLSSPKILQLSGIGPAETLKSAGVDVVVDSPNVGGRMLEHRCFVLQFRLNDNVGYNKLLNTGWAQMKSGLKYFVNHKGPLSVAAYDIVGFFKSRPELDRPDAQIQVAPFSAAPQVPGKQLELEREPGMMCIGYILRPDSEGSVRITSADPDAELDIDPNYYGTEHDRRTAVDLFRVMRELFATGPMAKRLKAETVPGPEVTEDQEILDAGLERGYCGYHSVRTCGMGPNDEDVVDARLNVRGVTNLRVVDASVLPVMVSGNLNGPVSALAWRAADIILGKD